MRAQLPQLFPRPRELNLRGGFLPAPAAPHPTGVFLKSLPQTIVEAQAALDESKRGACRIERQTKLTPASYYLEIASAGIHLQASDAAGVLYGCQTLRQIHEQNPQGLPQLEILDSPDLAVRGFMLDVSRCKVPTQNELRQLVRALCRLRVNQLQLYIEHTFAFSGHDEVWQSASPLTPAEIEQLDRECLNHGIELVPNLNTFGHMERWLKHPRYQTLAECPEGWIHPLTGQFKPTPATLRPDQASLDLIADLLDSYLPHFRSTQVNIGGDEPWELGQGFSKASVEKNGKHAVYLAHLKKICALASARGRTPQFWGDILLEDLKLAAEAPSSAVPVVWGYDAGHPFNTQAGRLHELQRDFLIAPGTSTWQSFTGRLDNALTNQSEAIGAAIRHEARGVLVTAWGDNGNHQPWPTNWLPMASGLAQAWCFAANQKDDTEPACDILGGPDGYMGLASSIALKHVGKLDTLIAKSIRNKSLTWEFLVSNREQLAVARAGVSDKEISESIEYLKDGQGLVKMIKHEVIREELLVGVDCALAGLLKAQGKPLSSAEAKELEARYRHAWLQRARVGGLEESVRELHLT
jgi:hexosaminidase